MTNPKQIFSDMQKLGLAGKELTLAVEYVIRERNEAFSDGMKAVNNNNTTVNEEQETSVS